MAKKWHPKCMIKMSQLIIQIYKLSHPALGTKVKIAKAKHDLVHIA